MDFRRLVDLFGSELPKIRAESDQWQELTREATAQLNRHMTVDAPAIMREAMTAFANGNMDVIENIEARLRAMCRESYEELKSARDQLSSSNYRQGNESAVLRALRRVQSQTFSLPPRIRAVEPKTLILKCSSWDGGQSLWSDKNTNNVRNNSQLLVSGWGLQDDRTASAAVRVTCSIRDRNGFMTSVPIYYDRDIAPNSDKELIVDLKPVLEKAHPWHDRLTFTFRGEGLYAIRSIPLVWDEAPEPPAPALPSATSQPLRVQEIQICVNTLNGDKEPEGQVTFELRHSRFAGPIVSLATGRGEHWLNNTFQYLVPDRPTSNVSIDNVDQLMRQIFNQSEDPNTNPPHPADIKWFVVTGSESEYINSGEKIDLTVNLDGQRGIFRAGVWWFARFKLRYKLSDGRIGDTDWSDSCDMDSGDPIRRSFTLPFNVGPP